MLAAFPLKPAAHRESVLCSAYFQAAPDREKSGETFYKDSMRLHLSDYTNSKKKRKKRTLYLYQGCNETKEGDRYGIPPPRLLDLHQQVAVITCFHPLSTKTATEILLLFSTDKLNI